MMTETEDTIAAVATPLGRAALGIVRISGKECASLLPKIFIPKQQKEIVPFRPTLGRVLISDDRYVDEAVLIFFARPHSYTREDLAEISCHGNPLILEEIVSRVISSGARLARPGEFTYRAFLNGRIDLVQAEAVQDLISADTLYQAELAVQQIDGRLSRQLHELRTKFIELISLMEGNIDFSEEQHYNFIDKEASLSRIDLISTELRRLLGTFERGRLIREGFTVAIAGKPNVGKSSIFNELVGKNRAIVTPIPGTTRDYLHERLSVRDFLLNLVDTAGIRTTTETIELEGVRRSRQVIDNADLVVFLVDGSEGVTEEDLKLWEETSERERILVVNKSDKPTFSVLEIGNAVGIAVSAKSGDGINSLLEAICNRIRMKIRYSAMDSLVSNLRHRDLLAKALENLSRARAGIERGMSEEFPLIDLHAAANCIGEITGQVTIDEIYQQIFSNFCIGK